MSFKYISETYHPKDDDLPERAFKLSVLTSLLHGEFYDVMPYRFTQEQTDDGAYIAIDDRAPNTVIGTNLIKTTVDETVYNTFGEGHTPAIMCKDKVSQQWINDLIEETNLFDVMAQAVYAGSVGSVAIRFRVLDERFFFEKMDTTYLTPHYDPDHPDRLVLVVDTYKTTGKVLRDAGYTIPKDNLNKRYWFLRHFTPDEEIYFTPWLVTDDIWGKVTDKPHVPQKDEERSYYHGLKMVNLVWIKNLHGGTGPDGGCAWKHSIDVCMAIDYSMSQGGRLLRYSADPLLVLKQPPARTELDAATGLPVMNIAGKGSHRGPVKAPGGMLRISHKDGDAKLLQMDGKAAEAVIAFCKALESGAKDSMHSNKIDPTTIGAGPRGSKALEIMNAPFAQLIGAIKDSYGARGLVPLLNMVLAVIKSGLPIEIKGKRAPASLGEVTDLHLRWPDLYPATPADLQAKMLGLSQAVASGFLSRETAITVIANDLGITDVAAEQMMITADREADIAQAAALAAIAPKAQEKMTLAP
jgi:hypothetical protein